ncbi:MAG: FmdB family zinc ribbon protein [Desulfopila sp.]
MPIYEFYCDACNVIFNFFSARIDTTSRPACPQCGKENLSRQISRFATLRSTATDGDGDIPAGIDEGKMEQAFESLIQEAGSIDEDDPRQMASLMRRFSTKTGLRLGDTMEEAIRRMEAGEDPEQIEQDLGDTLGDDDFTLESLQKRVQSERSRPVRDEKLYTL